MRSIVTPCAENVADAEMYERTPECALLTIAAGFKGSTPEVMCAQGQKLRARDEPLGVAVMDAKSALLRTCLAGHRYWRPCPSTCSRGRGRDHIYMSQRLTVATSGEQRTLLVLNEHSPNNSTHRRKDRTLAISPIHG